MNQLSNQAHEALKALGICHQTCHTMAMVHCLELGGEHARPQHLRLMLDCAGICAITADFIGRKSQFHTQISALCVEICETCAEECQKLGQMDDCVIACRTCADRCREIARSDHASALNAGAVHAP
jgi:hypothetical protein